MFITGNQNVLKKKNYRKVEFQKVELYDEYELKKKLLRKS